MKGAGVKVQAKLKAGVGKAENVFVQKLTNQLSSKCRISTVRRSSSSDSSDSKSRSSRRRSDKKSSRRSRTRSRDRSRDRYGRSRRSRSRSSSTYKSSKSRSYRSKSRDRYRDRHRRSRSRDRYRSRRSRSKSYIKEYVSKPKRRSHSSSSTSSSECVKTNVKHNSKKKEESNTKGTVSKKEKSASPDCIVIDNEVLDEINENSFAPKQFTSKSKKVPENIVIDLKKNTIKVPEIEQEEPDSIFHQNLFLSDEARMEKWVRELYSFRQKALQQGSKNDR
ncbi:serine/Arginine-related protein 53-like isoform X2 [Diabrotica virgifera virgifera]|uniref:Uncharacterized protein n=1 Tax=Diabrotica virgifera virgifera TaxID=50390 RepID=A0ABM5KLF4_DIAVI|nr:serine/Arginine-related protein 53-like isoform X2 [Diabrotica virgifera virgifera]